jgi:predicted acylesterase/phospholipase RssA
VLSGGGAKGAYHIGCLKALRAAGIDRFAAISGSSVGAINAVLHATDQLDAAETAWRALGPLDIVRLRWRDAWRLPIWMFAALGSEFSPFKISRLSDRVGTPAGAWLHPVLCGALSIALWLLSTVVRPPYSAWAAYGAIVPIVLAALTCAHRLTRPVFLRPVFTDNTPLRRTLANAISDEHVRQLREARVPLYGVLSQRDPGAEGSHHWGGWIPRYVRLDRARDAASLCRTLADGSAVPGFLTPGVMDGRAALDGAWTDNMPAAPLLFGGHDLDAIIVVYLKQTVRHTPRHNSLCSLVALLARDAIGLRATADLHEWARARWAAYRSSPTGPQPLRERPDAPAPMIVSVAPSARIGNFFTGTLWFSRAKSASLIDAGERDMRAALDQLTDPGRRLGIPAAAQTPARASRRRSIARALWRLSDEAAAE